MQKKHVSLKKQSKRAQKEHHAQNRESWGNVVPITKTKPSGKLYNRKKSKQDYRNQEPLGFFIFPLQCA